MEKKKVNLKHLAICCLFFKHNWNFEDISKVFKISKKQIDKIIGDKFYLDEHYNRIK